MPDEDPKPKSEGLEPGSPARAPRAGVEGVSRREFLKISAITVSVPAVVGTGVIEVHGEEVPVFGPGKTPVTLTVNGSSTSGSGYTSSSSSSSSSISNRAVSTRKSIPRCRPASRRP